MDEISVKIVRTLNCDVFVCGGGVAGIAAAVCAARSGADVILAESAGYLGGAATAGSVGVFMTCMDASGKKQLIKGFFSEFVEEMIKDGGAVSYLECPGGDSHSAYRDRGHKGVTPYDVECFKRTAERLCTEAGVKLLYNALFLKCDASDGEVKSAYVVIKEGVCRINAKVFIDTSGDGMLAADAGAETMYGGENGEVQNASMIFAVDGVDKEALDRHAAQSRDMRERFYMDEISIAREKGEFPCGTLKLRMFEGPCGIWYVNMAQEDGQVNALDSDAVTAAQISQRKQIPEIISFLKKNIPPLKDIKLVSTAAALGVRESRRIRGEYVLTEKDITGAASFDDKIAVCANSIDIHCSDHIDYRAQGSGKNYCIPLRCLIVKGFSNLLTAGRCVSADHYALAAIRVMPPSFAMGQAAGITAALAVQRGGDVPGTDYGLVREKLLESGANL